MWLVFALGPGARRSRWLGLVSAVLGLMIPLFVRNAAHALWPWFLLFGFGNLWLAWIVWALVRPRVAPVDPWEVRLGVREGVLGPPLTLPGPDRFLHVHVLGPTGAGKSEGVLWPLLEQDVARPVGLTLVDPKGDLAVRLWRLAQEAGRPVTFLGPGGADGWNPLAGGAVEAAERLAYAFATVAPDGLSFFRTLSETLLKSGTMAVKEVRGEEATLADVLAFLSDEDARRAVLTRVGDPTVRAFFRDQYARWTPKAREEYTMGLRTALADVLSHPEVRRLTSGAFDLRRHLETPSVLAVALPLHAFGASGRLFGRLLLAAFVEAALSRQGEAPHFLYVDEFQEFATPRFQEFLAMARSYRVGAVLAHQSLGQLAPELRQAVLANARTRVLLGGLALDDLEALRESLGRRVTAVEGAEGARLSFLPRYDPLFVRALPRGRALVQAVVGGQVQEPCIVRLPAPRPTSSLASSAG